MRKTARLVISLLFLFISNANAAIDHELRFTHISLSNGLSQSTVFDIAQDKRGFMWFATFDGLNKYDGYDFTVYRNVTKDSTSLSNNSIRTIHTDSHGNLWVGTDSGLSLYNETEDNFRNFFYRKKDVSIKDIIELSDSVLILNTSVGLKSFHSYEEKYSEIALPLELQNLTASDLYRFKETIYIGTTDGRLFSYDISTGKADRLQGYLSKVPVQSIIQSNDSELWIGTEGEGLYLYNLHTKVLTNYKHTGKPNEISSNYIRALAFDGEGTLWIGTFNDLSIFDKKTTTFYVYTHNILDNESLSQRSVRSIFMDSQGGMWLGTYFGGLNYFHELKNSFTNIRRTADKNSLNDNVVSCITEDKCGKIWIGTNDNGVNYYDPDTRKIKHYKIWENVTVGNLESDNIKCIYPDETSGLVYVGVHAGGINILHPITNRIEHYNVNDGTSTAPGDVYSICKLNDQFLLLGTLDGLYTFDKVTRSIKKIVVDVDGGKLPNLRVTIIYKDSNNRYWIGAENGLAVYTITNQGIKLYVSHNEELQKLIAIQDIKETSKGSIVISTRNGFYVNDPSDDSLLHFTVNEGLPNNVVYGAEEDGYGRIWLSTNFGLSRFTPQTATFRNFTTIDGLQSNEFNNYSHCRLSDGTMFFGGINGITSFLPEKLSDNPFSPQPVITELLLFNQRVLANDKTGILTQHISDTESITLNHHQNSITLQFVVSNYTSNRHDTFAYRLLGYNNEWYYTSDERKVSYSNLAPGNYTFQIKAANSDGIWNNRPSTLNIVVLPAWYATWWAKLSFVLLITGVAGLILRHFWIRKNMQTQLEFEKKDKEHQEEISQMKLRFFINISHELRTPLTLILSPIQELIYKTSDKWTLNQLRYIERNANRLLHLINQLMDYRRADLGVFRLKVYRQDIHQPLKEICSFYEKLARNKRIQYSMLSSVENRLVYVDRQYMELILNNLLSNSFKYTDQGEITVSLSVKDDFFILEVKDTGQGISKDNQERIFERFYQIHNEYIGSGIGLSLVQRLVDLHHGKIELQSEIGKGSTFTVYIPQQIEVYQSSEFSVKSPDEENIVAPKVAEDLYLNDNETLEEGSDHSSKKGTILVVEPDKDVLKYISGGLRPTFTIIKASNGEEALQKMSEEIIDLVIADVSMSAVDGIKLCKHLKQNISTNYIPVVVLSAQTDVESQMEVLNIGADDYIEKPFSLSVLTKKVQNILKTRQRVIDRAANSIEVEPEKITFNSYDEDLLKRAVDVITRNMDNTEFSTEDFAAAMCMSRSSLHLKLKNITGESATEFIKRIRFAEACRLIKEGKYSVSEISTMVGFNTPSYFATCFKKYVGCLPTEYSKKFK